MSSSGVLLSGYEGEDRCLEFLPLFLSFFHSFASPQPVLSPPLLPVSFLSPPSSNLSLPSSPLSLSLSRFFPSFFLGRAFLTIPLHPARNANGRVNLTKVQYADGGVGRRMGGGADYGTFKFTNSVELVARQLD